MNPKRCSAWFKDSGWYIVGQGINEKWGWTLTCGPLLTETPDASASVLGRAIRRSLDGFRMAVPDGESSWRRVVADLWAVGVRGWSGLNSCSRSFTVSDDGELVRIYRHGTDEAVTCDRDPDEIGRALLGFLPGSSLSPPLSPPRPGRSRRCEDPIDGGIWAGRAIEAESVPVAFGCKTSWLAIDTEDTRAVVEALGLIGVRRATWAEGIYKGTFVAPSILGWTLVEGVRAEAGEARFLPFLEGLSRRFGEVQYFGTHRVVGYNAWARALDGRVVRGYAWLGERGELLLDVGPRSPEEEDLGFRFIDRNMDINEVDWDQFEMPGEDDVLRIAGRWSINPQDLDAYESRGSGFLGVEP